MKVRWGRQEIHSWEGDSRHCHPRICARRQMISITHTQRSHATWDRPDTWRVTVWAQAACVYDIIAYFTVRANNSGRIYCLNNWKQIIGIGNSLKDPLIMQNSLYLWFATIIFVSGLIMNSPEVRRVCTWLYFSAPLFKVCKLWQFCDITKGTKLAWYLSDTSPRL